MTGHQINSYNSRINLRNTTTQPGSIINRLNSVLTYIEFFKSSMTNGELLTAIQNQMSNHDISKEFISNFYDIHTTRPYIIPVTLASVKLYEIINELESKCNTDHINLNI